MEKIIKNSYLISAHVFDGVLVDEGRCDERLVLLRCDRDGESDALIRRRLPGFGEQLRTLPALREVGRIDILQ